MRKFCHSPWAGVGWHEERQWPPPSLHWESWDSFWVVCSRRSHSIGSKWACTSLLTALHRRSSFWMIQSRIFLRRLSLFVIAAINVELNSSLIALSSTVSDGVLSSLLGLRYVVKESVLFPGFFGGVFCVGSCSDCISKEFCFSVSNWLVFVLIGKCDFAISCCVIFFFNYVILC